MVREIVRSKVALIGDDKIGKTKLLNAFLNYLNIDVNGLSAAWNDNYLMTIEIDLKVVTINIPDSNYCVELQIFDFGGNELFNVDNSIRRKYLQMMNHVIAAYNISSRSTFDSIKSMWLKEFKSTHNTKNNNLNTASGIILGLQSDLSEYSTVNPKEVIELAKEYNMVAMQCSSKTNQDVDTPFNYIANQVHLKHITDTSTIQQE
eukprot:413136_1